MSVAKNKRLRSKNASCKCRGAFDKVFNREETVQ